MDREIDRHGDTKGDRWIDIHRVRKTPRQTERQRDEQQKRVRMGDREKEHGGTIKSVASTRRTGPKEKRVRKEKEKKGEKLKKKGKRRKSRKSRKKREEQEREG